MKLRCVCVTDDLSKQELTYGEIYEFLGKIEDAQGILYYRVKNNAGRIVEYFADRFEIVDEVAPELELLELSEDFMDEIIGLELIKEDLEKEEVKGMRSLRERVIGRLDYSSIAQAIWDKLEDEIIDEVSASFDEDEIVSDMIYNYKRDYINTAKDVLIEELYEDISSSEIEDHIKDIAREKVYE